MNPKPATAEVALRPVAPLATAAQAPPSALEWDRLVGQARMLVASGFLPKEVNTAEKAVAIALTGQELGIPTMLALRSIHIINGKPVLSADLMASLVLREIDRHRDGELVSLPPTAEAATVRYRRWGARESQQYTFTIEDARRAGLAGRDTWKAYPQAMLRARALATVCRMAFPDVVAGLYVPGELPDDEDGERATWPEPDMPMPGWQEDEDEDDAPARVIDVETGEILDPDEEALEAGLERLDYATLAQLIATTRQRLGWDKAVVLEEATRMGVAPKTHAGALALARWIREQERLAFAEAEAEA